MLSTLQPSDKTLKRGEVAALLRVNRVTVHQFEKRGLLNPVRFNSRIIRYKESEVLHLLEHGAPSTSTA